MLPKGIAQKVIIYLNEDTRAHLQPLWSSILSFLRHKQVSGATAVRSDAGFGAHQRFHDPHSEYIAEHNGIRIEFIESVERVQELLPAIYDMVTDGLVTVQDVTVVKSVALEKKAYPPAAAIPKRLIRTPAKMIRIYLGESDKHDNDPLYEVIVRKLQSMDFAGATVYRGILGYGAAGKTRKAGRFGFSRDLPIMISVIETAEKLDELVAVVSQLLQDGIIVTSDVELHHVRPEVDAGGTHT